MKSALKKSVVSTSISLILASGMAAFAAHAADDVKLKATKTNVAFSDFTPTEYSTKGKRLQVQLGAVQPPQRLAPKASARQKSVLRVVAAEADEAAFRMNPFGSFCGRVQPCGQARPFAAFINLL